MTISTGKLSLEEFFKLPEEDRNFELIEGEAIAKIAPKLNHSRLTRALCVLLESWSENRGELGIEWAIILQRNNQDWVLVPDLLYISYDKIPKDKLQEGACPLPPELVIEIISPGQSFGSISQKATDYLKAGISRVWLVDSQGKNITIFYPDKPLAIKSGKDSLQDEIFPELELTVEQIFLKAGLL